MAAFDFVSCVRRSKPYEKMEKVYFYIHEIYNMKEFSMFIPHFVLFLCCLTVNPLTWTLLKYDME